VIIQTEPPASAPAVANPATIHADLTFMTRRWVELPEPCKFEMRSLVKGTPARMAHFTPGRIEDAVKWAMREAAACRNVYMMRNPIRLSAEGFATDKDVVAAFFVWVDADSLEAAQNVLQFAGPRWSAAVTTGTTPSLRGHVYWPLAEPCFNLEAWRQLEVAIADHFKADRSATNPSRIMRVAGTVAHPDPGKMARGYVVEACTLRTEFEDEREPVEFERLLQVFPPTSGPRPAAEPREGVTFIDTGPTIEGKTVADYLDMYRRARTDGEKHGGVRDLTASLAAQGVNRALMEALVRFACPVWDANVESLIDSAYKKYAPPAPEGDPNGIEPIDLW
jgi:hypothetical protein